MNNIEYKLAQLKAQLESLAFMVRQRGAEKEAHAEIVQILAILSELENMLIKPKILKTDKSLEISEEKEVAKVSSRLKRWEQHQYQINSRILNAFLKLKRAGKTPIRVADLRDEVSEVKTFNSNFAQMKTISKKNHGKVFELQSDNVSIWSPVATSVREYERIVFENN